MGNKAKKRIVPGAKSNKAWSDVQIIQLWAWLDYCLMHGIEFNTTIIGHLKTATQKEFSHQQVHDKLKREWIAYGKLDSEENDVYSQGTACLAVPEEWQDEVRTTLSRLEPPSIRDRLRSASSMPRSRSRTLPTTRMSSEAASTLTALSTTPQLDDELNQQQASRHVDLTSEYGRQIKGEPGAGIESPLLNAQTNANLEVAHAITQTTDEKAELRVTVLETELSKKSADLASKETDIAKQRDQIFSLTNRLFAALKECDEIRHCTRATVAHQSDPDMIKTLRCENSILKGHIAKEESLKQGVTMIKEGRLGLSDTNIQREFNVIEAQIAEACSSLSIADNFLDVVGNISQAPEPVATWVNRVSGCAADANLCIGSEQGIPRFELIRSLVAAGLCTLVFESNFPNISAVESPLLEQYRKHIRTQNGSEELYKLDILAHRSLVSETYFESHIVTEKAAALARYISQSLEPFLLPIDQSIGEPLLNQDGQSLDTSSGISPVEAFEEVCAQALRLKTNLFICQKRYTLIFFNPGQAFDDEIMDQDGCTSRRTTSQRQRKRARSSGSGNQGSDVRVKLCLFPALYRILTVDRDGQNRDVVGHVDYVAKYNTFELEELMTDDVQKLKLVVKAVVIV